MSINWKETTADKYEEMLEVLPPAVWTALGFLVGEPLDHGTCPIAGKFGARFEAFAKIGARHFVADQPLTIAGFRQLTPRAVLESVTANKARAMWASMDANDRAGVRFGMFPFATMQAAEKEGYDGRMLAVLLIDVAINAGLGDRKIARGQS